MSIPKTRYPGAAIEVEEVYDELFNELNEVWFDGWVDDLEASERDFLREVEKVK